MLPLIVERKVADVVYGSRFYGGPHRSLYFHHYLGNRLISLYSTYYTIKRCLTLKCVIKCLRKKLLEISDLFLTDLESRLK